MPLPAQVKIGGYTYSIVEVEGLESDEGTALNGEIVYHELKLELAAGRVLPFKAATLMHEIVHGLITQAGHILDGNVEEEIALGLGYGLAMLIHDNPDLVKFIQEAMGDLPVNLPF